MMQTSPSLRNGLTLAKPLHPNGCFHFLCFFIIYNMSSCVAMLSKSLKNNSISTWEFYALSDEQSYYARSSAGKTISCTDLKDLRRFYKKMLAWGFAPADIPIEEAQEA